MAPALDAGALLALAYPERLAEQRGARGRFRMANGSGARLDEADPLASEAFLAIGEVQGGGPDARILLAAPIDRAAIEELFPDRIRTEETLDYDAAVDAVRAFRTTRLNSLVLARSPTDAPRDERTAKLLTEAALSRGLANLPWPADIAALRERIAFLRRHDPTWPDFSDAALTERAGEWLLPLSPASAAWPSCRRAICATHSRRCCPGRAWRSSIGWRPQNFPLPPAASCRSTIPPASPSSGSPCRIFSGWRGIRPCSAARFRSFSSCSRRRSGRSRSRATCRVFGAEAGAMCGADMRGRYPKHFWPEDPAAAEPASGAKRRR